MGSGMIFKDCDCDDGQAYEVKPVSIDKRSKAYREAIEKIMATGDVSREEAMKVFETEFDKIV
jgi:hypothetical protein